MQRIPFLCTTLVLATMSTAALAGDVGRDAANAGASIGAGVGAIVGNTIDGIGRGIEAATTPPPRETVIIERRTVVEPVVPARPCVRTADGERVCEGD